MNKPLLLGAVLGLMTACQRESDIQPNPSSLAAEVAGTYRTNFFLDPSCVAIPAEQMPYAELKVETDSSVTLLYTKLFPAKDTKRIPQVVLRRQADVIVLRVADSSIGTLQTDRIFTNSGMEKQGKLLRINIQNDPQNGLYFAGFN